MGSNVHDHDVAAAYVFEDYGAEIGAQPSAVGGQALPPTRLTLVEQAEYFRRDVIITPARRLFRLGPAAGTAVLRPQTPEFHAARANLLGNRDYRHSESSP